MVKQFKIIFLISLLPIFMLAKTDYELFQSANQLYKHELFDKALEQYDAIITKNSSVYQNMGLCCFYLKSFDQALMYWKKAARGAPYSIRKQLYALEQNIFEQKLHRSWHIVLFDEIRWMLSGWSLLFLQLLFLLFWILLFVTSFYQVKKRYVFANLFCSIILIGFLWVKWIDEQPCCIVSFKTPVFVGPNSSYQVIGELTPYSVASVSQDLTEWCKVEYGDVKGWVSRDCIQII